MRWVNNAMIFAMFLALLAVFAVKLRWTISEAGNPRRSAYGVSVFLDPDPDAATAEATWNLGGD